ncbi:CDP-glycerol glycerophosphotransferase family protein [Ruminococcus sp. 5_1_39BFAA]|uniref:CDP-glycerol glycerophosphotransferase family protein n=1 Tax=Ruminococcus sp. 5_1_39BFAA TaxID=457412 RepID=UPI003562F65A
MSEIEKLLRENIEEYEAASRQAMKYVAENKKDLEPKYEYAGYLDKPVKENQIFFLWENKGAEWSLPKKILDYVQHTYGREYTCICMAKSGVKLPGSMGVKQDTPQYWEALACSKYIISSMSLPLAFVKRKEQIYFNTMSGAYEAESLDTTEGISVLAREMLKTDFSYAVSPEEAEKLWTEKTGIGKVYDGVILVSKEPEEDAGEIGEIILGKKAEGITGKVERLTFREPGKKKLLVLTSWKAEREQKLVIRRFLREIDRSRYDVAVMSAWVNEPGAFRDFAVSVPGNMAKVMYRGRMVMNEEDYRNYRIIEKNPDVYVKYGEVRRYVNSLVEREWGRALGTGFWDVCLLLGSMGYLQYYMAAGLGAKTKVLVDLDFLAYIREKHPSKWRVGVTVFDRIYAPSGSVSLADYGMENRIRAMRLPVFVSEKPSDVPETVQFNGNPYLICDKWQNEDGKTGMKLVQLPSEGGFLVNGDMLPDEKRKEALKALGKEHSIYVLGMNAAGYTSFLPDAVVLDEFVRQGLYLLPSAWTFYGRLSGYLGDSRLDHDVLSDICKAYGVNVCETVEV